MFDPGQELAKGCRRLGRVLFEQVKQGSADSALILEGLIHGYLRRFSFEKALVCQEALLKLEPGNIQALLWRGRMRATLKHRSGAREDFETALKLVPQFAAARYYLCELLLNTNQFHDAETHLKILNEQVAENLNVRLLWARCRIAMGDDAGGRQLLDLWLADVPPDRKSVV